jgi:hypothetical protein
MSAYSTNQTQFKDAKCLIAALIEMGFNENEIEFHEIASQLIDFQGRPTHYTDVNGDKAEIVIRRTAINRVITGGASNDLGFKRNADGSFDALISAYDSSRINAQWLGKLTGTYARIAIVEKAKKQGLRFIGTTKQNGKTQLQFIKA